MADVSEMIERVAKAMYALEWEKAPGIKPDFMSGDHRQYWLKSARTAIEAMREPTFAMEQTGGRSKWLITGPALPGAMKATEIYQAMIDEALK